MCNGIPYIYYYSFQAPHHVYDIRGECISAIIITDRIIISTHIALQFVTGVLGRLILQTVCISIKGW